MGYAFNFQILLVSHLYKNYSFMTFLLSLYFYIFKYVLFPLQIMLLFPTLMF